MHERILELLEGGVGGDGVGHVLCPLCFEKVAPEPANEGRTMVLRGTDSRWQNASTWTWTWTWDEKHALERAKRGVGLEHVAESDEATHLAVVADEVLGETMGQKASTVSGH